ncbi:MAG: FHA domain-containing protein [Deltaproteobacteria bacterium]|nr:MAG: FHA domain-containing protein [Deltaproteobacteria bacterium]
MAQLILKFKDIVLKDFDLAGDSKTIGREPGNDIVVENLLVSGYHARVDAAGKDYILTDLQSKNGTFVNGEQVTSKKLKNGDQILIGKHLLVFSLDPDEVEEAEKLTEETMFIGVAQGTAETPSQEPETPSLASTAISVERPAVLSFMSGGGAEYEITRKLVKLGKGAEADVQIGGFFTPKVAATISRRPTGYHLTPVGRAKIKVNDTQVKGSRRLREFDTIEVGPVKLQFYYKG